MSAPHRAILFHCCAGRLAVAGWLLNAALALAAVEVTVDPNPLELGEIGQYQVTTDGGAPEIGTLPTVKGLQWTGGPQVSTSVQIINMQITRKATATWTFTVEQPGRYVIPAITVTVGGKPQRLPERVLVVTSPAAASGAVTGASPGDAQATAEAADGGGSPFFLRLFTGVPTGADTAVYVGQEIPLEIRMYLQPGAVRNISYPEVAVEGGVLREDASLNPKNPKFLAPQEQSVTMDGRPYQLVTFRSFLTPITAGTLKGQVVANAQVVLRERRQSRNRGPLGAFDDGFVDDFFNQARVVPRRAEVTFPAVTVKPLPPPPPATQSLNSVGHFTMKLETAPATVRVGEPVTLTLTIEGQGSLDGLRPPRLDPANFRDYDPEVKRERHGDTATATVTWVLVPLDPAAKLPELVFCTFDPTASRYVTTRFQPRLTVTPAAPGQAAVHGLVADSGARTTATAAAVPARRPAAAGADDILYVKAAPGPLVCRPLWYNHLLASVGLAGAGLAAWGLLTLLARRRERLMSDLGWRRRAEAARMEKRLFRELRNATPEARPTVIRDQLVPYLTAMLGLPPGASVNDVIARVEPQDPELAAILRQAEAGAYRPGGGAITDINPALAAIRRLLLAVLLPLLTATLGLTAPDAAAAAPATCWNDASAAYSRGDVDTAKRLYQNLAPAGGESAAVLYNQGNCAYRQGHLGEALADYERAWRLAPRDSDILENLNFVRRKLGLPLRGGTETPRELLVRLRDSLRPDEWALLVAALVAATGLAAGGQRWRGRSPWPVWGWTLPVLLLCALAGWSQLEERYGAEAEAVVVAEGITPRRLPSAAAEPAPLRLREGDTLALMETRDGWCRLRGPDGEAWLPHGAVRTLW